VPVVCINTLCTSFVNLALSATSWYEYLSFSTWPSSSSPTYTPDGMRGRNIYVVGFLRGDLGICILSFYYGGGCLEIPVASSFSSVYHSGQAKTCSMVSPAITHYFGHPGDVLQACVQALKRIFCMRKVIGFSLHKTCF
jgi:hypothetical protein